MNTPTVLVILDGFGWSTTTTHNAIKAAHTPHLDYFFANYPHAIIQAAGTAVGLPEGYIGNSEVGHLTIGAGRIIPQDIVRINTAITDGSLQNNPTLKKAFTNLARSGKALHLAGLLSDAGVHSHSDHLFALLHIAKEYNVKKVYVHAFLDGRDVAPESAATYLQALQTQCTRLGIGTLASITGRFYAMDRDNNWQRTQLAYECMTSPNQSFYKTWQEVLHAYYHKHISDEFIPPTQLDAQGIIHDGDGLIFFNFRPDRARQLTACFAHRDFDKFPIKKLNLAFCITMTDYDEQASTAQPLFEKTPVQDTLKEALSSNGKTIFSIAETEKYAHITYFFGGWQEKELPHETRVLIPSIRTKNYVDHPCMSAQEITDTILTSLTTNPKDFYIINYANADMVGHSGDFDATVKAIECLDTQLGFLYDTVINKLHGTLYITGDHGKAEDMFDTNTQQPKTAHTTNPVPFIMMQEILKGQGLELHITKLSDIAPFILKYMELPIPKDMIP